MGQNVGTVRRADQVCSYTLPSMALAKFGWQELEERAHVGERFERHDFEDDESPRQWARPVPARHGVISCKNLTEPVAVFYAGWGSLGSTGSVLLVRKIPHFLHSKECITTCAREFETNRANRSR
jgi:hypothetical protein